MIAHKHTLHTISQRFTRTQSHQSCKRQAVFAVRSYSSSRNVSKYFSPFVRFPSLSFSRFNKVYLHSNSSPLHDLSHLFSTSSTASKHTLAFYTPPPPSMCQLPPKTTIYAFLLHFYGQWGSAACDAHMWDSRVLTTCPAVPKDRSE